MGERGLKKLVQYRSDSIYQEVRQVDASADEGGGRAVLVLLVAAEDDLVQVRNDLERLARDEQN